MYYCISRNIDSDFNLAIWQMHWDRQVYLCHYRSIYTTSMGFLHTVLKSANLKSRQQRCLSKPPNIMFANISAYTVLYWCHSCLLTPFKGVVYNTNAIYSSTSYVYFDRPSLVRYSPKHSHLLLIITIWRETLVGGKHWQIWRSTINSPKFLPPTFPISSHCG